MLYSPLEYAKYDYSSNPITLSKQTELTMENKSPKASEVNGYIDNLVAGAIALIVFFILKSLLLNGKNGNEYGGSLFVVVLLTALAWFGTLKMRYKNPEDEKRLEAQKQWAEQENAKLEKFRSEVATYIEGEIFSARYLGGSGNAFEKNAQITIGPCKDGIYLGCLSSLEHKIIPIETITLLEISGEGTVTTNAGVVGGGFGVEGFIKGAIVAEVLNAATTKSSTNTFLRIMTTDSELYFHTSEREPAHLQILFSKVFVHINSAQTKKTNSTGISDELLKLHSLFKDGALTQDEFDVAKRNLLER